MNPLKEAIEDLDDVFGEGFAQEHPEIVVAFMQARATDRIALWLKRLGNNDAATPMGAIEGLAAHLGEKIVQAAGEIAGAIDPAARERAQAFIQEMLTPKAKEKTQ